MNFGMSRGWQKKLFSLEDGMLYDCEDDNILQLRSRYPEGLHFVVGDLHGEVKTLMDLMSKIQFDAEKDHVYFIGDYSSGGNETALLSYLSRYYQADTDIPGFHLIRGNHERELSLSYPLENLPDLYVVRGKKLTLPCACRDGFGCV